MQGLRDHNLFRCKSGASGPSGPSFPGAVEDQIEMDILVNTSDPDDNPTSLEREVEEQIATGRNSRSSFFDIV